MISLIALIIIIILTMAFLASLIGIEVIVVLIVKLISGYITSTSLRWCAGIAIQCFGIYSMLIPSTLYKTVANKVADVAEKMLENKENKSNS